MRFLFPGQQKNEKIHMVLRQHWFYFLEKMVAWLIFVVILFAIDYAVSSYLPGVLQAPYLPYFLLLKNIYVIFLILGLFILWTLYYLEVQIVTNERVVDITHPSIFRRFVSELHLSRIEDVTSEVSGIFATMFSYGNVYIQTAGSVERFTFDHIPHPEKVEKLIVDLSEQLIRVPKE